MRKHLLLGILLVLAFTTGVLAQAASTIINLTGAAVINMPNTSLASTCPLSATGTITWCWTGDGKISLSQNGAAYVQVFPSPTPAVTSVNGKTGAVVLGATASAPVVTMGSVASSSGLGQTITATASAPAITVQ